ncbi:hypothetical protein J2W34_000064 [Variovorax boronicumulans]|uniref:hypothetical protein n=1 Tax=Variovorax boronicumulans TaxID=436515 RepID=UPI00277D7E3B|nr:hypothetical protein [Variovorax boronicumulans]MDQ0068290.1 hypothetical protein [Variovorax boronicumulans]
MTEIQTLPGVSWWHVIVQLERQQYTHGQIAASIGSTRGTVEGWKNKNAEPAHEDGERLVLLWLAVTGKSRDELPRRTSNILSAASFR